MRLALRLILALLILCSAATAIAYLYLRQSLPELEGQLRLGRLTAPAEILRDAYGIPHIFAAGVEDASFALGFAHAQDRLWQMEIDRRIGAGRLAEILGPGALETDRFIRTLGVRRAAAATLPNLDPETRRTLEAYAAGVNAFLIAKPVLPVEFWLTGARPEPWTPVDSLTWVKMMAWDLGGNWRDELLRMQLAKSLPLARIHEILPPYPGDAPLPITDLKVLYGTLEREAVRLAEAADRLQFLAPYGAGLGSNNWVAGGARTESGRPLLANDPHLGLSAPSVWYFAHLSMPGTNLIGATLPGVPLVVLGRSDRLAWGFTNTGPDVQDLYIEKLDGAGNYLTPDGPRAFEVIDEVIRVKGGEDVRLQVRVSRHGPVISDVSRGAADAVPRGHVIAFAWTALRDDDLTMQALVKMMRAQDCQAFLGALFDFHSAQQNVVCADTAGNIGFVAAGRVPIRKPANDLKGLAPAPGWDAKYDWAGFIPFEELPRAWNPPGGTIHTANHKIVPSGYPHFITSDWQPPYRADRIAALLAETPKHSLQSFARMQADVLSPAVKELLPRLLKTRPRSEEARRALALLAAWDARMDAGRIEPLIIAAWWRELTRALYADELGEAFNANWRMRAVFVSNALNDRGGQSRWCDDVRTPAVETCDELLALSLEAALADLRERFGPNQAGWRWGEAHFANGEHRPFSRQALLARYFDIRVPTPGDAYTVNVGRSNFNDAKNPFANRHAASLRALYDLSDLEQSLFIHSAGQSGNVLSPHYKAFALAWSKGEYVPMVTDRKKIEAGTHHLLRLVP